MSELDAVCLVLSRETVETIRSSTRRHLQSLEERAERVELAGHSAMYWRTCAKVVEEGLVELEERYAQFLRSDARERMRETREEMRG